MILHLVQADIWDFATRKDRHVFYLVSDPAPDVMGSIYFREGHVELFSNTPTRFTDAEAAIRAAEREGYEVKQ